MSSLSLRPATPKDAPRIAEIHMAAFSSNAMLHAQFPTPASRAGLQVSVRDKTLLDIEDAGTTTSVLVVVVVTINDEDEGKKRGEEDKKEEKEKVIAFAKYTHPIVVNIMNGSTDNMRDSGSGWTWPEGTNLEVLGAWTAKAGEAEGRAVGDVGRGGFYALPFIGTDPAYSRRGAGKMLVRWGIERAEESGAPIYLESTVEAVGFYKGCGFQAGERIRLPITMGGEKDEIYEEVVFVYWPGRQKDHTEKE